MLGNINYHLIEDARRILTLLCFARRPLTVEELIDGVAVEIHNSIGLNRKRRLQNPNGIRDICGGFIGIDSDVDYTTEGHDEDGMTATVRIAHSSVQEYLESERIRHQKAAMFSLASVMGHADIAQICLTYLLERGLSEPRLDESIFKDYPLARYAAMHWYYHYETTTKPAPGLDDCILRLFQSQDSFVTWIKIHDPDRNRGSPIYHNRSLDSIPSPVYYASLLGLDQTLHELIKNWQSNSDVSEQINAQGGRHGNALQAASVGGHVQVVQMLLEKGADVNNPGGTFGNALQAASSGGHIQVVQMLLDKGAIVNAKGGFFGNALQIASYKGHTQVLQVLLHKGAHVNEQGGFSNNALQAASINGHIQVVQMLLDNGANVNAQGGKFGNALHTASFGGHVQVVQMLLDMGADVNAQSGKFGNALQIASYEGHIRVVQMLLDKGADVNARGGKFGNALHTASFRGHVQVVQVLLNQHADITAEELSSALQEAKAGGHSGVVQLLQNHHAALCQKQSVAKTA